MMNKLSQGSVRFGKFGFLGIVDFEKVVELNRLNLLRFGSFSG